MIEFWLFFDFSMSLRLNQLLSLLSAGAFLLVSPSGHAASFDCTKATSITEKTICANDKLSKLDSKLSVAWNDASDVAIAPAAIKASQLKWLKLRDACGADTSCLSARYNERLAALMGAQSTVYVDQAGNRLEALIEENRGRSTAAEEKRCTVDKRLCVQVVHEDADSPPLIQIDSWGANPSTYRLTLSDIPDAPQNINVTLWPHVLRLVDDNGVILVGVMVNVSTAYSGGGGDASELRLFEVGGERSTLHEHEVLSVPIAGSLLIRACFTDQDARRRLGACHDDYQFTATLGLDQSVKSGFPRLIYQTRATSFPGKVSRNKDSLAGPPLRKRDLVTAVDQQCTYKRIFHFKADQSIYMPEHPLPDCSNYTVP
ncbi:DUF1311 domain-containing protein [Burkholderia vietnamiensis]|uniref:lysozyme inhibitor LprI family protein n=1 Tax=Burkholderia vietnamiensis TaxID=60552 RepID=UPI0012D9BC0D|nr:lysozyme inhibitor LprI family protein [Burkholderia vietnamiensis]MBR7918666.1 DUF1311 domain-containing protein [Burkholderia vietnamiensis]